MQRFSYQSSFTRASHVASFVVLLATDVVRCDVGQRGNLGQHVFHLTAFLFLSICPLLPALLYFSFFSEHLVPFDSIVGGIFVAFLCCELVCAFVVLRDLLRGETTRFMRLRELARVTTTSTSAAINGEQGSVVFT